MSIWPYPWHKATNPFVIPPGMLRYQIEVQAKATSKAPSGSPAATWNTVLTVMSAISTIGQKEVFQANSFTGQVTHRVSIKWPGASIAIVNGMQVKFGTRTFVIQTVENVQERNRVLHFMCLEIDGSQ